MEFIQQESQRDSPWLFKSRSKSSTRFPLRLTSKTRTSLSSVLRLLCHQRLFLRMPLNWPQLPWMQSSRFATLTLQPMSTLTTSKSTKSWEEPWTTFSSLRESSFPTRDQSMPLEPQPKSWTQKLLFYSSAFLLQRLIWKTTWSFQTMLKLTKFSKRKDSTLWR